MKNLKINFLSILLFCFFLNSCKVYLDVEKLKPKVSKEERAGDFDVGSLDKLVEGDRILVRTIHGEKHNLFYKQINGDLMIGTTVTNVLKQDEIPENIEFEIAEIEKLWVKRASASTTIPIVLISSLGIAMGILIIGLALNPISF